MSGVKHEVVCVIDGSFCRQKAQMRFIGSAFQLLTACGHALQASVCFLALAFFPINVYCAGDGTRGAFYEL